MFIPLLDCIIELVLLTVFFLTRDLRIGLVCNTPRSPLQDEEFEMTQTATRTASIEREGSEPLGIALSSFDDRPGACISDMNAQGTVGASLCFSVCETRPCLVTDRLK